MQRPSTPPPALPAASTPAQQLAADRTLWNHYLLDADWRRTRFNDQPNALLVEAVRNRPVGAALDVNMGEGRNALYLAQLGWQVTGFDIADKALILAQQRAQKLNLHLNTFEQDVATFDWGVKEWDLIVLCYADEDAHVAQVQAALKSGGLLVFENFHAEINQTRGSRDGRKVGFETDT